MQRSLTIHGFTFIELLVVMAVMSIIFMISFLGFQNLRNSAALRAAGTEVYGALTSAREKTLASQEDSVYGVRIASTSVTRFAGVSYSTTSPTNSTYVFESGVTATGTLVANRTDVVFRRLTGEATATGTVYLRNVEGTGTTTIRIDMSGLIEYE